MSKKQLHNAEEVLDNYRELINSTPVDFRFLTADQYEQRAYVAEKVSGANFLLDVGRSLREQYDDVDVKNKETLDINDFGEYPDIIGDLCQQFPIEYEGKYDAVVVLAVLEHVYDPFAAVENIKFVLAEGGTCFVAVPYMYRYHASRDLQFSDYYRYSRDALCYMFRDFSEMTLYPMRGKYAAIANFLKPWRMLENRFGFGVNKFLNNLDSDYKNTVQASGYLVELKK